MAKESADTEDVPSQVTTAVSSGNMTGAADQHQQVQFLNRCSAFRNVTALCHHSHNPPDPAHPGGFWDMLFSAA